MNRVVASSSSAWWQRVVGSCSIRKQPSKVPLRAFTTRISIQHPLQDCGIHPDVIRRLAPMALAAMTTAGMLLWDTNENDPSPFHHHQSTITQCEESSSTSERPVSSDTSTPTTPIKFSKMGVNREDVEALVQVIMKDPSVNMTMLPDALEAQLYKSTILLTLNAIYSLLGWLDGVHLLSHELKLSIERSSNDSTTSPSQQSQPSQQQQKQPSPFIQPFLDGTVKGVVNDDVLRQVAKRLLMNPAVNSPWIPDALEEQVYTSCLQVVFRVIQVVFSTFRIEICGHDLTLQLASSPERLESAILAAAAAAHPTVSHNGSSSSNSIQQHRITPIDLELLQSMAQRSGVDDKTNPSSIWSRLFTRSDFVQQLHISLYGLILGILDDLFLGHLKVQILSDDIVFDLVPSSTKRIIRSQQKGPVDSVVDKEKQTKSPPSSNSSSTTHSAPSGSSTNSLTIASTSFVAGMGVGVTLMTLLSNSSQR